MRSRHLLAALLFMISSFSSSAVAQGPAPAATATPAQSAAAPPTGALPVRRVVLYKTGVGYFEHLGNVRNRQDVAIRFTSAQLNDVLKSLTAIDMGNGQVTGISYNSVAPMEQRLGALRIPLGPGATTVDLLARSAAHASRRRHRRHRVGRLLSVERRNRAKDGECVIEDVVSWSPTPARCAASTLTPALHVRIVDRDLRDRSLPVSRRRRIGARAGRAPDGDLDVRQRRAAAVCQLRQRSADLEDHVSAGAA